MSNIQKYSSKFPIRLDLNLAETIFPDSDGFLELIISIEQENVNIKEFSSYLDLIYRIDGQLSEVGYLRYVQNPKLQIEITNIKLGSVEILIEQIIHSLQGNILIIIYLALKFLPKLAITFLDLTNKSIDTLIKWEDYLEKKERRKIRKHIRELINQEVELTSLDKKKKEKLVDILDMIYIRNKNRIPPASRFGGKYIRSLRIRTRKRKS